MTTGLWRRVITACTPGPSDAALRDRAHVAGPEDRSRLIAIARRRWRRSECRGLTGPSIVDRRRVPLVAEALCVLATAERGEGDDGRDLTFGELVDELRLPPCYERDGSHPPAMCLHRRALLEALFEAAGLEGDHVLAIFRFMRHHDMSEADRIVAHPSAGPDEWRRMLLLLDQAGDHIVARHPPAVAEADVRQWLARRGSLRALVEALSVCGERHRPALLEALFARFGDRLEEWLERHDRRLSLTDAELRGLLAHGRPSVRAAAVRQLSRLTPAR